MNDTHRKVYVVDDDADQCAALQTLIRSIGIDVQTFPSARAFLNGYDPAHPACLILDLRMPEMSGLELLRLLTARNDCLPIIMLTAFADVPSTVQAMKCGAKDVLEKPYPPQQLIEKVQIALNEDELRCQRSLQDANVSSGLKSLTPRENEVLEYMMQGKTSKQIARELVISVRTVDFHRRNILEKMSIDNPIQLARLVDEYRLRRSAVASPR